MTNKEDQTKKRQKSVVNAGLGAAASEVVNRFGSAASEHIKGYKGESGLNGKPVRGLKDIAKLNAETYKPKKQQSGFSGEILYENRTNARNIINKSSDRIRRTDVLGDTNHMEFDHVSTDMKGIPIKDQYGNYTGTSQMKLRGHYDVDDYIKNKQKNDPNWVPDSDLTKEKLIKISAKENVNKLLGDTEFNKEFIKYENAESIHIPKEQYTDAKLHLKSKKESLNKQIEVLKEKDDSKVLQEKQKELQRVESLDERIRESLYSKDAMAARINAKLQTVKEIHAIANEAGWEQAKYGAFIGGSISLSREIVGYVRGEGKDLKKSGLDVTKDTAGAATLSYATGYSGTVIKSFMETSRKESIQNLSKSNMPAMIASSAFEVGKSIFKYITDESFSELELVEELGEKGTGMMAASMGAATGTVILPGVGTVVGGMVGYMTSSTIYRSSMDLLKDTRLSEENLAKVEQLAQEAIISIERERQELSDIVQKYLSARQEVFERCFTEIENSISTGNHEEFVKNLDELAITFGVELQFVNFDDFDDFMSDDTTVFKF